MKFDINALSSIRSELEVKWIDVHKGSKPHEFWQHEWEKHGTCAMDIKNISSEIRYFKKGLELFDKYDMKRILAIAKILPGQKYHYDFYLNALRQILGTNAFIECQTNPVSTFFIHSI